MSVRHGALAALALTLAAAVARGQEVPVEVEPVEVGPTDADSAEGDAASREPIEVWVDAIDVPIAKRLDPTPAAYVIRGDALARPGASAADLLARVPGVQPTRSGGAADMATVSIRGATSAQTPIYLAGVRLNDELTGTVDLSSLPLWMLHRIEVYRGNAPAAADELGIGGAIFLEPRLPRGSSAAAALGAGSFGERMARASLALGGQRAGAALAVRHRSGRGDYAFIDDGGTRFDEGDDSERRRVNADHSELDAWAVGRVVQGRASLAGVVNSYAREAGAPGLQLIGAKRSRAEVRRVLSGASATINCPGQPPRCALLIDSGILVTRYRLNDPLRELGASRDVSTAGERLSHRLRVNASADDWLQVSFGGSQSLQLLRLDIDRAADRRARRHIWRADMSALGEVADGVHIAAVGALECHSTAANDIASNTAEERTCGVLEPVGRLGARWRLIDELAIIANIGRYVRVPTLGELYGISSVVRGNAELLAEDGFTLDTGMSMELSRGPLSSYGQLVGFARFAEQLIAYRRSSVGVIRPFNAMSARLLGAELAAGLSLWRVVNLGLAVALMDPRDTSEDRTVRNDLLPLQARLVASPRLELASPSWRLLALDRATIGATYRHRSSRVADPAGLIVLEDQGQLDLDATLSFAQQVGVRMRLANLIDQRNFDLVGYPLPGRSGHGTVEVRW